MTMGERINELRTAHNMSMDEFGKAIGVGRSAIHKYEKGQVENIPKSTVEKMAILFGVSPSYILCLDEWDENAEALSDEVALLERIQAKWGKDLISIIEHYCQLNEKGKWALITTAENLSMLDKYKK